MANRRRCAAQRRRAATTRSACRACSMRWTSQSLRAGRPFARRADRRRRRRAPARRSPRASRSCVLISPARGYGAAGACRGARHGARRAPRHAGAARHRRHGREALGPAAVRARERDSRANGCAGTWRACTTAGYRQAVELLCGADLLADLPPAMPVRVACGALDVVTTPAACAEVAQQCGVPLELLRRRRPRQLRGAARRSRRAAARRPCRLIDPQERPREP